MGLDTPPPFLHTDCLHTVEVGSEGSGHASVTSQPTAAVFSKCVGDALGKGMIYVYQEPTKCWSCDIGEIIQPS